VQSIKKDPGAYGIVNAIDNRNAFKAWSLLKKKYDKTGDAVDMTQLETDWNNCKMESDLSDAVYRRSRDHEELHEGALQGVHQQRKES
jgi:hypothetical protein